MKWREEDRSIVSASAIGIDSDRPAVDQPAPGKNGNGHKPNNGSSASDPQAISEERQRRQQWPRQPTQ